jgi:metallo-beta-lactamase family protein
MDSASGERRLPRADLCHAADHRLCSVVLPDSGHLQEEDAAFYNKRKASKHDPALPLYTLEEAQDCLQYFKPVAVGRLCN